METERQPQSIPSNTDVDMDGVERVPLTTKNDTPTQPKSKKRNHSISPQKEKKKAKSTNTKDATEQNKTNSTFNANKEFETVNADFSIKSSEKKHFRQVSQRILEPNKLPHSEQKYILINPNEEQKEIINRVLNIITRTEVNNILDYLKISRGKHILVMAHKIATHIKTIKELESILANIKASTDKTNLDKKNEPDIGTKDNNIIINPGTSTSNPSTTTTTTTTATERAKTDSTQSIKDKPNPFNFRAMFQPSGNTKQNKS